MEVLKQRPDILNLVKTIATLKQLKRYDITDLKTNAKGEGYLGEIFFLSIKEDSTDHKLNIVIKAAFTQAKIRDMEPIRMCFENEIYYYSTIYPAFKDFWKSRGIQRDFSFAPEFIYGTLDQLPEMLVLENLKNTGFQLFDKTRALDHNHMVLIFKNYGRYHALSMAMREQNPEQFHGVAAKINNDIFLSFVEREESIEYLQEMAMQAQKSLQPGIDDHLLEKFKKYTNRDSFTEMWKHSLDSNYKYSAILHGDCWSNNMMFKYDDSKPVELRLIDFQLIQVGSPVCDLSFSFYSGVSKEGLNNLDEYLNEYYKSFSETARELGSNPRKIYPLDELKNTWNRYSKFGFIMTFDILRMKMTEQADTVELTDDKGQQSFAESFKSLKFKESEYNERMRAIIQHMYDLNAL